VADFDPYQQWRRNVWFYGLLSESINVNALRMEEEISFESYYQAKRCYDKKPQ
jgi:hypothetical protein